MALQECESLCLTCIGRVGRYELDQRFARLGFFRRMNPIIEASRLRGLISTPAANWLSERIDDHNAANISAVIHVFRIQLLAAQRPR